MSKSRRDKDKHNPDQSRRHKGKDKHNPVQSKYESLIQEEKLLNDPQLNRQNQENEPLNTPATRRPNQDRLRDLVAEYKEKHGDLSDRQVIENLGSNNPTNIDSIEHGQAELCHFVSEILLNHPLFLRELPKKPVSASAQSERLFLFASNHSLDSIGDGASKPSKSTAVDIFFANRHHADFTRLTKTFRKYVKHMSADEFTSFIKEYSKDSDHLEEETIAALRELPPAQLIVFLALNKKTNDTAEATIAKIQSAENIYSLYSDATTKPPQPRSNR